MKYLMLAIVGLLIAMVAAELLQWTTLYARQYGTYGRVVTAFLALLLLLLLVAGGLLIAGGLLAADLS